MTTLLAPAAFMVGGFAVLFLVLLVTARLSTARSRRQFLQGKQPLSNAEFLSHLALGPDDELGVLATRRALAEMCAVADQFIHPGDRMDLLAELMEPLIVDGWDPVYFWFEFQAQTGIELDQDLEAQLLPTIEASTVGHFAIQLAINLRQTRSGQ